MDDCIFCKIASGQIATDRIAEGEHVIAFRDNSPQAPVHVLVIPREHVRDMAALDSSHAPMLAEVFTVARAVAQSEGIETSGYRVTANVGADAGQSVFHLHFHLLGGRKMGWPPG